MEDLRELTHQLVDFFRTSDFFVTPVQGGASTRQFFRLDFRHNTYFPENTVMLMIIPPTERRVMNDYINVDYYFKRKDVPTPRIYEVNLEHCWIFQHFEESPTLEMYLKQHPDRLKQVIPATVQFIQQLQKKCSWEAHCPAFQRRFDFAKYMYEFNFHVAEQLLGHYFHLDYDRDVFQDFAESISRELDIAEPVFTHRDFQSSNIFITKRSRSPRFSLIDFQDARHGTPIYDLVSCLWDSYLPIPGPLRQELVQGYYHFLSELNIQWDRETYERRVDYTVIQRKLHDAGAFAYNFRRFKSKRYVGYIQSTLRMVLEILPKYPHFSAARELFETCLEKSEEKNHS